MAVGCSLYGVLMCNFLEPTVEVCRWFGVSLSKWFCAFMFRSESVDQAVEKYNLQKITLLREISIKTGIQVVHLSILLCVSGVLRQACSDKAFLCASPADLDKGVQL